MKPNWLHLLNYYILQWLFLRLASWESDSTNTEGWILILGAKPMSGYHGTLISSIWSKNKLKQ